jgi:hypothetical protein
MFNWYAPFAVNLLRLMSHFHLMNVIVDRVTVAIPSLQPDGPIPSLQPDGPVPTRHDSLRSRTRNEDPVLKVNTTCVRNSACTSTMPTEQDGALRGTIRPSVVLVVIARSIEKRLSSVCVARVQPEVRSMIRDRLYRSRTKAWCPSMLSLPLLWLKGYSISEIQTITKHVQDFSPISFWTKQWKIWHSFWSTKQIIQVIITPSEYLWAKATLWLAHSASRDIS